MKPKRPHTLPHEIDGDPEAIWIHLICSHGIHPHELHSIPDSELVEEHLRDHWTGVA